MAIAAIIGHVTQKPNPVIDSIIVIGLKSFLALPPVVGG
jgi:hypothetical protein